MTPSFKEIPLMLDAKGSTHVLVNPHHVVRLYPNSANAEQSIIEFVNGGKNIVAMKYDAARELLKQ
jgi:hypothetical protein